ncbi:DUF2628 domain-containing protein [Pseudomonadota bacterium]
MSVYSVHIRESGNRPDMALVKDGFSWPAAVFGFVWAFVVGAWELGIALVIFQTAMGALIGLAFEDPAAQGVAQIGLAILIGLVANELRRLSLEWRGLREAGTVVADSRDSAERRYLDANPFLTARLLAGQ